MPSAPVAPTPKANLPAGLVCAVSFVPLGDGTFRAVPQQPVAVASISKAAKLTGLARDTIYRLFKAEMIAGRHASPGKIEVDVGSLVAHIERSKEPDYWTEKRVQQYQTGLRP